MATLGLAIWYVIEGDITKLDEWNHDYDDYTTAIKVFMIIFSVIPIVHQLMLYVVWY